MLIVLVTLMFVMEPETVMMDQMNLVVKHTAHSQSTTGVVILVSVWIPTMFVMEEEIVEMEKTKLHTIVSSTQPKELSKMISKRSLLDLLSIS